MVWRKATIGLGMGCVALAAACALSPGKTMADDARHAVSPAVYRVNGASAAGAKIQLVRHHGYNGGRGWGWGGGYRGYGYAGFHRPYYARPFYGAYYGASPGYGYGYGSPGYGYGGGRCW
jgi:hypothetical protein